jgi:hypothetical protein
MFRLLAEREYADGLARLRKDIGKTFDPVGAGDSLIWLRKPPHRPDADVKPEHHQCKPCPAPPAGGLHVL